MKLSNFTQNKDNNFNIIRIIAALAVLITHSYALATGTPKSEPLRAFLGMTMGSIAVDVFFITSGFLVTASLLNRQSAVEFIWARLLRVLPALFVMLLLTVFILGSYFTTFNLTSYLTNFKTYVYLIKNTVLMTHVSYNLPGVFDSNPYQGAVNGSLWTLPYEIRMYAILLLSWLAFRLTKSDQLRVLKITVISAAFIALIFDEYFHFSLHMEAKFTNLFFMFFSGAAFYVLREQIRLSRIYVWLFFIGLMTSALINKELFFIVYTLTLAYVLFYLAYVPSGYIRNYNRLGDYSYGVYIYAFPIQQSIAALMPGVSVFAMILISTLLSLILAALSWHLIERRVLGLKYFFVNYTRTFLASARLR